MPRPGRPARAAALAAAFAASAGPAWPGDRSLTGSISQQFIADSNVQLREGDGSSLGSITSVGLRYADERATSTLSLSGSASYSAFTGRENDNISGLFPTIDGGYVVRRPTRTFGFNFGARVQPVDFFQNTNIIVPGEPPDPDADDPDPEVPDAERNIETEALRIRGNAGFTYNQQVNSRDSISASLFASFIDFTESDDELVPSQTLGYSTGWNRVFTSKVSGGLNASVRYFQSDDVDDRRTISIDLVPGLSWQRTPNESYSFSLGPAFNITERRIPLLGGGVREEQEETISARGSAGITYTGDVSTFSASLSQEVDPTDEGVVANRTTLRAAWNRRLSATSSLNLAANGTFRTALSGDTDPDDDIDRVFGRVQGGYQRSINTFSSANAFTFYQIDDDSDVDRGTVGVGANYSYRLTEAVSANLGYTYRLEDSRESSHRVFLTLSRGFTLIP
ncbi:MAG: hypothetical protein AAGI51_03240 [Pseudomonadota bacterium]